jgi:hypothetical protein
MLLESRLYVTFVRGTKSELQHLNLDPVRRQTDAPTTDHDSLYVNWFVVYDL